MTPISAILCAGAVALFISWPSDAAGLASLFIFAAGVGFTRVPVLPDDEELEAFYRNRDPRIGL